jgi:hypothetical protein
MAFEERIVDAFHVTVAFEEPRHLERCGVLALHAHGEGLEPLRSR